MIQDDTNRIKLPLRIGNVGHDTFHPRGRRPQQAEMQPVAKHHRTSVQDSLDPNSLTAKSESGMTCLQLCQNNIIIDIILEFLKYHKQELWSCLRRNRHIGISADCSWSGGLTLRYSQHSASCFSWTGNRQTGKWRNCTWKPHETWHCCVHLFPNYKSRNPNPFPKADPVSLTLSSASSGTSSRRLRR